MPSAFNIRAALGKGSELAWKASQSDRFEFLTGVGLRGGLTGQSAAGISRALRNDDKRHTNTIRSRVQATSVHWTTMCTTCPHAAV